MNKIYKLQPSPKDEGGAVKKKTRRKHPPALILRAGVAPETPLPLQRFAAAQPIATVVVTCLPLWNELISLYKHGGIGAGYGAETKWKKLGYQAALKFAEAQRLQLSTAFKRAIGSKKADDPIEVKVYDPPYVERGVPIMLVLNVWRGDKRRFDTPNVNPKSFADGFTYAQFWDDDDSKTIPYFFVRYCGVSPTQPRCEVVIYRLK